jgi:predicted DNA-binding protein (MmcQ/YjbR family)
MAFLSFPGAFEDFPFGPETSVFKVMNKMFGLSYLDGTPLQLNLKCAPETALHLRATFAAITPGYHMNKRHWNTIVLDGSIDEGLVLELIEDSYDLVVRSLTRAQRAELEALDA